MVCYFLLGCPRKMLQNSHILSPHRKSDWNSREGLLPSLLCSSARCSRHHGQGHCCCLKIVGLTAACPAPLCEPSPIPHHAHFQMPPFRTTTLSSVSVGSLGGVFQATGESDVRASSSCVNLSFWTYHGGDTEAQGRKGFLSTITGMIFFFFSIKGPKRF